MPFRCCVPNCRGNFANGPAVSTFKFPTDPVLQQKWLQAIKTDNFLPSKSSRVCILHFLETDIEKFTTFVKGNTGEILTAPLKIPRLSKDAVPSQLLECSIYLSKSEPSYQESTETKRKKDDSQNIVETVEESVISANQCADNNKLSSLEEFHHTVQAQSITSGPAPMMVDYEEKCSPNVTESFLSRCESHLSTDWIKSEEMDISEPTLHDHEEEKSKSIECQNVFIKKEKSSEADSDEDWGKSEEVRTEVGVSGDRTKCNIVNKVYPGAQTLSPQLAALVGQNSMARQEVVKKIWSIIKAQNLYDPSNKQYVICNDALFNVIGIKRFRAFGMMKYLKNHIGKSNTRRSSQADYRKKYSSEESKPIETKIFSVVKKETISESNPDKKSKISEEIRRKGVSSSGRRKSSTGNVCSELQMLSPELAALVGQSAMARQEVMKKIWSIIIEQDLYDPSNRQYVICNDGLFKVIGVRRFHAVGIMRYLKKHFITADTSEPSVGRFEKVYLPEYSNRKPEYSNRKPEISKIPVEKKNSDCSDYSDYSESDSDVEWGKSKKPTKKNRKRTGRTFALSPELAALVGKTEMSLQELLKTMWSIIRERNLYDPANRQYAICDDALFKVFRVERFRTFGMLKYLKNHFVKPEASLMLEDKYEMECWPEESKLFQTIQIPEIDGDINKRLDENSQTSVTNPIALSNESTVHVEQNTRPPYLIVRKNLF